MEVTTASLDQFFDGLQIRLEAAQTTRKEMDRFLGSGYNLLDIFYPDENRLSYAISRLLDPNGGHGQGTLFLEKFCELLPVDVAKRVCDQNLTSAKSQTEVGTSENRRIDVVVTFDNHFAIGIENKPWAIDQIQQLEDYADELKRQYKDNFVLIYLSGYSLTPSEISLSINAQRVLEEKKQFVTINYNPHLITWLNACAIACEAEKVRWFLRDFAAWVANNKFPILEAKNEGQHE